MISLLCNQTLLVEQCQNNYNQDRVVSVCMIKVVAVRLKVLILPHFYLWHLDFEHDYYLKINILCIHICILVLSRYSGNARKVYVVTWTSTVHDKKIYQK